MSSRPKISTVAWAWAIQAREDSAVRTKAGWRRVWSRRWGRFFCFMVSPGLMFIWHGTLTMLSICFQYGVPRESTYSLMHHQLASCNGAGRHLASRFSTWVMAYSAARATTMMMTMAAYMPAASNEPLATLISKPMP